MKATQPGNQFDRVAVADSFPELFGGAMSVEFGCEGSAVMYVTVPFFAGQRIDNATIGTGACIPDEERIAYAQAVIDWARVMRADEITARQHPATDEPAVGRPGPNPYEIRIWWD